MAAQSLFIFTLIAEFPLREPSESGHAGGSGTQGAKGIRGARLLLEGILSMTTLFTLARGAALAAVLAAGVLPGGTAFAAPEDVALLNDYLGSWRGVGAITGPKGNTETTACRLDFFDGNGDKINFSGRCSLGGTAVTMSGAMVYVDGNGTYEAVMTTSVGFTGRAVGVRNGNGVRFDLREIGGDPAENMDVNAALTMANSAIEVGITVIFKDTGDKYFGTAPFSK